VRYTAAQEERLERLGFLPRVPENVSYFREYLSFTSGLTEEEFNNTVKDDADVLKLMELLKNNVDIWALISMGVCGDNIVKSVNDLKTVIAQVSKGGSYE